MKVSKSWKQSKKRQLYHFLRELHPHIENEDDFAMVVGYTIVNSLLPFKNKNQQEKKSAEVMRVYTGLNDSIVEVANSNYDLVLAELIEDVEPQIRAHESIPYQKEEGSLILSTFLESLNKGMKNYEQPLRTRSLDLYDRVSNRGQLRGNRLFCRQQDFSDLYKSFTKEE